MSNLSEPLAALAAALGVATTYDDYLRRPVVVGDESVRLALQAMGVEASDDEAAGESLEALRRQQAERTLPHTLVVRPGERASVPAPADGAEVTLVAQDGTRRRLAAAGDRIPIPVDIPLGYHSVQTDGEDTALIVSPGICPLPLTQPSYGWMAQLYATRSRASWGMGDCRDLADLARWAGGNGAAMILVNPLHATAPVLPQESSPYSPTSRRYRNPLYIRIEDVAEFARLDESQTAEVQRLAEQARNAGTDRIDRDTVLTAKMGAFDILASVVPAAERATAFAAWCDAEGQGLVDFATYCVLAEAHGRRWQDWPAELRHPANAAVASAREAHNDRLTLHMWLQWVCDTQLAAAQAAAAESGMEVGIIHDLAVGVDPGGADAWALQDDLATGVTVGAPPDGFNQRGQDWGLPPLLPHRLAETGHQPFRDMLRSVLHHAGGIRIDHIMALWRLWWVHAGQSPARGTYVQYPARDLLGVLALEAHRAGALVVGEDLGTVADGVHEALAEHRILSSRVLYFERVDDDPEQPMLPAADYPEAALVSISTHDLPTAAGWWADQEIKVQAELNLFGDATTPAAETRRKARQRQDMLDLLRTEGLVGDDPDDGELVEAMHAFLARTPAVLIAASLGDALGDRRQPNMPGTIDEYPNWRLPLAVPAGDGARPIPLDELFANPRLRRIASVLRRRGSSTQ